MRHVILHYHVFKNAGSTFSATLQRNFGERFASFDSGRYNVRLRPEDLIGFIQEHPGLVALSSHNFFPPVPRLEGVEFHEVLILRDPVDRIRSMYDFYRRERIGENPLTTEAKRLRLPQFVEFLLETRPHLIANPQTNLIANGGGTIPTKKDAERAALFVRSVAVTGVVEKYELCALGAEQAFRPIFPDCDFSYVPENVSRGRARDLHTRRQQFRNACGEELYKKIVNLSELDKELTEIAAAESIRRFEKIISRQTCLRSFRRRVACRKIVCGIANRRAQMQRLWNRTKKIISGTQESQT